MVAAERIPEDFFVTILDFHSSHGADGVAECERKEKVRLGKFAPKDEEPEENAPQARLGVQDRVTGCEGLRGEILARLACDAVAKHPTRGHDAEQQGCDYGDEELSNTED